MRQGGLRNAKEVLARWLILALACSVDTTLAGSPPVLLDKVVTTPMNTKVTFALDASDPDGDDLTGWRFVTFPSKGYISGSLAGDITYTPNSGFVGTDSFMVSVGDTGGDGFSVCMVTIHVGLGANVPPTARITVPTNGAVFAIGANIAVTASASDSGGSVTKVEFYAYNSDIGYKLLGSKTSAPYTYTWSNVAEGNYAVFARATDNSGFITTSARNSIKVGTPRVNTPAAITIISPVEGAVYVAPATVVVEANIQDDTGLRNVILTRKVGTGDYVNEYAFSAAPFKITKTNLAAGVYTWKFTATDDDWAVSVATVTITIVKAPTAPPAAPSLLTAAAVSASQVKLSWKDNSNNETGFRIQRKKGTGGTYAQVAVVGANATNYTDSGLTERTTYFYKVCASNSLGSSSFSSEASATTPARDTDGDGLPDWWEVENGFDSSDGADASTDDDGDGLSNVEEYVAGTDPKDPAASLQVGAASHPVAAGFEVAFLTSADRTYAVEFLSGLSTSNSWTVLTNNIPGTGGEIRIADLSPSSQRYYRIKVQM